MGKSQSPDSWGTAAIGSQSSPEPTPEAFYDGILTLARPLARR